MRGFSKLGITLTSVFSLLLLALFAELLYLLWRRRQQLRRKNNRIEPTLASTTPSNNSNNSNNNTILSVSSSHSEFLKFQGIYCPPSRVLFTIKEEDKDDELETDHELSSSFVVGDHHRVGLSDHFGNFHFHLTGNDDDDNGDDESPEVIIMVGDSDFDIEPPFLTPCNSPPYFTPSPSPTREEKGGI